MDLQEDPTAWRGSRNKDFNPVCACREALLPVDWAAPFQACAYPTKIREKGEKQGRRFI